MSRAWMALVLAGCGLDPDKVPPHALYTDDGAQLTVDGPLAFALIGNTRLPSPTLDRARATHDGATETMLADILAAPSRPRFVLFTGDEVRSSTTEEWIGFGARMRNLLDARETARPQAAPDEDAETIGPLGNPAQPSADGGAPVKETPDGLPALTAVGDRDGARDKHYRGWGAAFPGVGVDIGFNRVASWYAFDVTTNGVTWRFAILDSNRRALGSRWNEQAHWFAQVLEGSYDHLVMVTHAPLYDLAGGRDAPVRHDDGPVQAFLHIVDEHADLDKLVAVLSAGSSATQVFLPEGPFGVLYVDAGGGGAPADDLARWGELPDFRKISLEPTFDLALMAHLETQPIVGDAVNIAKATGDYSGLTGTYVGRVYPTYGWWEVSLDEGVLDLVFHHWRSDHGCRPIYTIAYEKQTGWVARRF